MLGSDLAPMFISILPSHGCLSIIVRDLDTNAELSPHTTHGELQQHQHGDFTPYSFMESTISDTVDNEMPFTSADFSMMDSLWPVLPDPGNDEGFPLEIWDPSLELPQPHFGFLSQSMPSSVPIRPSSLESEPCGTPRKRRKQIPLEAKKMLNECFEEHKANPYVTQEKMKVLASQTGLSLRQVRTFFANARARKLPPVPGSATGQQNKSANRDIAGSVEEQQNPMQRFLSTSPEDEGISEELVKKAANRTTHTSSSMMVNRESKEVDTLSTSDTTFSSNSGSGSSQASIDSVNSRGPRRGRKRQREPTQQVVERVVRKPSNPLKKYQCTFCASDFAQKFDWTRHEESVHFPQKQWICMPGGATYDTDDSPCCVFCNEPNPDVGHLETHNSQTCLSTSLPSRTFLRKDKLVQHLTQVHRCCQFPRRIQDWCVPIKRSVTLVCGLCGLILPDWHTRTTHISSHYQAGVDMSKWILDYPGGIVAHIDTSEESTQSLCNIVLAPDGDFQCDICPDCFGQLSHIVFHYRQTHGIYSDEDRVFMHVVTWPSDLPPTAPRKGLTDMAQNTFGMKLFKQRNPTRRKSISQIKRPIIPIVKKDVHGKGDVDQNNKVSITPPTSFAGVQTTTGISPNELLQNLDPQPNEMHFTPSKCKLNILYHQQLTNVTTPRNKLGINSMMPQGGAIPPAPEHVPADLMSQIDPKNPDGSTRPIPTYLRKAISMHYSAGKPKAASLLSKQHEEMKLPSANSMIEDTMPQTVFPPQQQFPSTSTSIPQSIPWPEALHEKRRFPIPAKHIPSFTPRPKRASRLSRVSMTQSYSVNEHDNKIEMTGSAPQNGPLIVGTDYSSPHMKGVADVVATTRVDRSVGGSAESAQYKCWDGQTRKPKGVADSAQYKCWNGQTRTPGGDGSL
jgi:hypothetical protein